MTAQKTSLFPELPINTEVHDMGSAQKMLQDEIVALKKDLFANWEHFALKISQGLENQSLDNFFILFLAKILTEEELSKLKSHLLPSQIESLNQILDQTNKNEVIINLKTIKEFSVALRKIHIDAPSPVTSQTLMILERMKTDELKKFMSSHPQFGGIVFENLSDSKATDFLNELSPEELNQIFEKSNSMNSEITKLELEKALKSFQESSASPFIKTLSAVVLNLDYSKEKVIYDNYIEEKEYKAALELASSCLPGFLIKEIPINELRPALTQIDPIAHARFLLSQENEEDKSRWFDKICSPDSKLREMINIELSTLEHDEKFLALIKNSRVKTITNYYKQIRIHLTSEDQKATLKTIAKNWIDAQREKQE